MNGDVRLPIDLDLAPRTEDIDHVRAGLMAFNESAVGPATITRVALYVRDSNGTVRGGLVGFFAWQWLSIDLLGVDQSLA